MNSPNPNSIASSPVGDEAALRRKNLITGAWVLAVILAMMAVSYYGRQLMVPVLFKT